MPSFISSALVASLAVVGTFAQTFTACSPLNSTCPPDTSLGQFAEFDFATNDANPAIWNATDIAVAYSSTNGAEFIIKEAGDAPSLKSNFYIFWGTVSCVMRISSGAGIISSMVLLSDDLDEIDFEFFGSNRTVAESNYFGKGNTSSFDREQYHLTSFAPQDDFHNYTFNWNKDQVQWIIDGNVVRTLLYADADGHGEFFPQTPMQLSVGSWAAGDPKQPQGTREWAQGDTDYSQGPFNFYVKSIYVQDGSTGSEYTYTDHSGSWQSIKVTNGTSKIVSELNRLVGPEAHWKALPEGARIGIIAGASAGFLALCGFIAWYCIKSARKGLREHQTAEAEWQRQKQEAELWQQKYNDERSSRLSSMNSTTKSFR